jgi:spore germination protein
VSPDKIRIGMPVLGYDWALPYIAGSSTANAISLISALNLANESNSIINFDEVSQTPYFEYNQQELSTSIEHIVWFIDARSVNSILSLISEYRLSGKGFWSIMKYYPQMWLVINSQFNIVKLIPDQI